MNTIALASLLPSYKPYTEDLSKFFRGGRLVLKIFAVNMEADFFFFSLEYKMVFCFTGTQESNISQELQKP